MLQSTRLMVSNFASVTFLPITVNASFNMASLLRRDAFVIPFEIAIQSILLHFNESNVTLQPVDIVVTLPGGTLRISLSCLSGCASIVIPDISMSVENVCLFVSIGLVDIQDLPLSMKKLSFSRLLISNDERDIMLVQDFSAMKRCHCTSVVQVRSISLNYNTLTGVAICPFVVDQVKRYVDLSVGHRVSLKFPAMNADVQSLRIRVTATDLAVLEIVSDDICYSDYKLKGPLITCSANCSKVLFLENYEVSVTSDGFLSISSEHIKVEDRHLINLERFFTEIMWAWRALAPDIVMHRMASESLPFPITIRTSTLELESFDCDLNTSLSRASRILPEIKLW